MQNFRVFRSRLELGESRLQLAIDAHKRALQEPGIFTSVLPANEIEKAVTKVEEKLAQGDTLPLAGLPFCVKDNLHVEGMRTTSNCPSFGDYASSTAPAVKKAIDAGAVLIGKNTMDQFATGLNGTRSPDPLCPNAIDPAYIPGGSSSGSAVAVALDICAFALGSDTGGSGRVPAAANGIVGFKPTPGAISGRGMIYCNRSFDVIPIFTKTVSDAELIYSIVGGIDPCDPFAFKGLIADKPDKLNHCFAVPDTTHHFGDVQARQTHEKNLLALEKAGANFKTIDFKPFEEMGQLVFGSALVAERLVDYGDFLFDNPENVLTPVATAINQGHQYSARNAFEILHKLAELRVECMAKLEGTEGLIVPTIPRMFTITQMLEEPMERNTIMGTYTYFANPIGLTAIAIPGATRNDGLKSSILIYAAPGSDFVVLQQAKWAEIAFRNT